MFRRLFSELFQYRELMFAMTSRDIRVKYKQAALGIAWVFLIPTLAICSGVMFRTVMALFSGKPLQLTDVVAVMIKSVPWLMFAAVLRNVSSSLTSNIGLMTQIYFPRQVAPASQALSALFDFVISVVGLSVILSLLAILAPSGGSMFALSWSLLWAPVFLMLLTLLAVGLGIFLASVNVFFRDVQYIVSLSLQYGIFFSLVYFTYTELGSWGWVLLVNPVSPLLEGLRTAMIDGQVDPFLWPWLAYGAVMSVMSLGLGLIVFERVEGLFADYA